MTVRPSIQAGLIGDDLTRAKASDANQAAIIEGRRRAARALLAPPGPRQVLRGRWAPLLHPERAVATVWAAEGPPPVNYTAVFPLAYPGDHYRDTLTGDLYVLEES